jgi:hypothetical protein
MFLTAIVSIPGKGTASFGIRSVMVLLQEVVRAGGTIPSPLSNCRNLTIQQFTIGTSVIVCSKYSGESVSRGWVINDNQRNYVISDPFKGEIPLDDICLANDTVDPISVMITILQ